MNNPFQDLVQDDEDNDQYLQNQTQNKPKRTHQQRRQHKKKQQTVNQNTSTTVNLGGEIPPERIRQDAKVIRNKRAPPPTKGIPEGHTHDRRSGTGRLDRARKEGGGFGNVGNIKDDLHKDKYVKENQQTNEQVHEQEKKPQQPQKLTLAEYYQSKGINLNTVATQKKALVKSQINADWIKKEKLTVMQTKQDKKKRQQLQAKKKIVQQTNTKTQQDATQLLGFGTKPAKQNKEEEHHKKGHKGKGKVVLNEDDFPTL